MMTWSHTLRGMAAVLLVLLSGEDLTRGAEPAVDFARDVRPLLQAHCWDCHGPDTRESGLRLDRRGSALAGGDAGQVILPGDPEASPLLRRILSEDDTERMPPDGDPLSGEQIEVFRRWIAEGAPWPANVDEPDAPSEHWAFRPVVRREPPEVQHAEQVWTPIDGFVLKGLETAGVTPSAVADRYTLIKRLYYDLLGLPPEPDAVDRFVQSDDSQAYEQLVDELLRSPHFGERWGRHWLDMARYADSDGYEKDHPRYNAWKYRDWVIQAVNDDMPFDQFTLEQLAGDLLPEPSLDRQLATAFHRQTLTNTEGGTDQEQWRVEAVFDRVETLGTVWLGLTVGCARCHSHKYDPIAQREYYQLFAFFNNGDEVTTEMPSSAEAWECYQQEQSDFETAREPLLASLEQAREQRRPHYDAWEADQRQRLKDAGQQPAAFFPLPLAEVHSEGAAAIEPLEDGSYLVSVRDRHRTST